MAFELKKAREELAVLNAEAAAILEQDTLTDEMRARALKLNGKGKKGDDDFALGEIDLLEDRIAQWEKVEARTAELVKRNGSTTAMVTQGKEEQPDEQDAAKAKTTPFVRCQSLKIPVRQQFRHGSLKAFTGPHAENQAYLAGMFFLGTFGVCMLALRDEKVINW